MKLSDIQIITESYNKLEEIVEPLKTAIQKEFPNGWLLVNYNSNLMSDVTIKFTLEPKEQWINKIYHNASYLTFMISSKSERYDTGKGPYRVELLSSNEIDRNILKFRAKSGTLDQIVKYMETYFSKLKDAVENKNESIQLRAPILESKLSFDDARKLRKELENQYAQLSKKLKEFPGYGSGKMGLTPDHVRTLPEYQKLDKELATTFKKIRDINSFITKNYKKEMKELKKKIDRRREEDLAKGIKVDLRNEYDD